MSRIEFVQGDITLLQVDAVVNAANRSLSGGGGVDGAIHRAAGTGLLRACRELGPCETGSAKITLGFNLPAKYVIHAVGPVWYGGHKNEAELLKTCYRASLNLAVKHGVKSLVFPAISCGAYRYPIEQASRIAISEVNAFLQLNQSINKVIFALFDVKSCRVYHKAAQEILQN